MAGKQLNSGWIAPTHDSWQDHEGSNPHAHHLSPNGSAPRSSFARGVIVLAALFILALISAALCAVFASNHLIGDPSGQLSNDAPIGSNADQTATKLVSIGRGFVQQLAKELPKSNSTILRQGAQVIRPNGTLDLNRLENMAEQLFNHVNRTLDRIVASSHVTSAPAPSNVTFSSSVTVRPAV